MKTGAKIGIGAAILGLGLFLRAKLSKASQLQQNLFIDISVKGARLSGLSVIVDLQVSIQNLSGVSITLKNLWTRLAYKNKSGAMVDIGRGASDQTVLQLKDKETTSFMLPIKISGIGAIQGLLGGASQLVATTNFDVLGQPVKYPTTIDLPDFKAIIQEKLGLSGTGEPVAGYRPFVGDLMGMI